MAKYAIFVITAMALDFITFALIVPQVTIQAELNPIMAMGYTKYGIEIVLALKVICTIAILLLIARVERVRLQQFAVFLGVAVGLLGTFGNITAVVTLGRLS